MSLRGRRRDDGGLPARRAVVRWSWRLFRREWRQQVLVLALISVAVAVTVAGASAAYNMAPSGREDVGDGSHRMVIEAEDPDAAAAEVAAVEAWFDRTEQTRIQSVAIPGSVERVKLLAQDPADRLGAPLLDLLDGRYPAADGEVAITDEVADTLGAVIGATVELGDRDVRTWTVVGLVENPEDLDDDFGLVAPSASLQPDTVEILVDTTDDQVRARPDSGSGAAMGVEERWTSEKNTAAIVVYLVATVVLLLVALVAAAGFVVMAQRRQRQIGLLAATGATDRHLRLVMVANGAAVGAVAALVGTGAGLVAWLAIAPAVEPVAGHRIDRFNVPWWLIVAGMVLSVWTATAASWWPARAVARVPVTAALSERPPPPRPAHRSALVAGALVAIGTGAMWWVDPNRTTHDPQPLKDITLIVGVLAIAFGILLLGPIVLRAAGRAARRLPVTGRLALRDLARFQARSGMALGAVSLAVGIPIAIVITAAAGEANADEGNLSDRDLLFRIHGAEGDFVDDVPADEVETMAERIADVTRDLGDATSVPLEMAIEPGSPRLAGFGDRRQAVAAGIPQDDGLEDVVAYVATPELLDHLGIDPASVDSDAEILTVRSEPLAFLTVDRRGEPEAVSRRARLDVPDHSSAPTTLITPEAVERRGWDTVTAGWLVTTSSPLTSEQVDTARRSADGAGLVVEARHDDSTGSLQAGAIVAGSLVALAVVAMTVGLVRSEVAGDLQTLAAAGATGAMRRGLTAWTAGALALLGVGLGGLGAYLALASGYARELDALGDVPLSELALLAAGVPLLAAAAGWLLGGREPSSLVRSQT